MDRRELLEVPLDQPVEVGRLRMTGTVEPGRLLHEARPTAARRPPRGPEHGRPDQENEHRARPEDDALRFSVAAADVCRHARSSRAVDLLEGVAERRPDDPVVHQMLALARGQALDNEGSERALIRALELDPTSTETAGNLGMAVAVVEPAPARAPARLERDLPEACPPIVRAFAHYWLGTTLLRSSRAMPEDALGPLREAARLAPRWFSPHERMARVFLRLDRFAEAMRAAEKAVELAPVSSVAWNDLGWTYRNCGRPDRAEEAFRKAVDLSPGNAKAWGNLARTLVEAGRAQEVVALVEKALAEDPAPETKIALGGALFQAEEDRAAVRLLREALARLCFLRGRFRPAARFFRDAFELEPSLAADLSSRNRFLAARAAARAGEREAALRWLREELEAWQAELAGRQATGRREIQEYRYELWIWRFHVDLAPVRGEALGALPAAEREAWERLWTDVEAVLAGGR